MATTTHVKKEIHAFPTTLSGYTGISLPDPSNVLTNFKFTIQKEWIVSKVFQTLWQEGFETGPVPWRNLSCFHHSHVNKCIYEPDYWA